MNAVPFMKKPEVSDILKYREKIPAFDKAENIIAEETAKGNIVLHIGDAGCWPSETVVVIDFAEPPKGTYAGTKGKKLKDGREYQYLELGDNKGGLEITFGRIRE